MGVTLRGLDFGTGDSNRVAGALQERIREIGGSGGVAVLRLRWKVDEPVALAPVAAQGFVGRLQPGVAGCVILAKVEYLNAYYAEAIVLDYPLESVRVVVQAMQDNESWYTEFELQDV